MAAVAVMLFVMRMSHYFVALMVIMLGKQFLEKNQRGGQEGTLGKEQTLDGGESDYSQEQRNQRLDFQLQKSEDREKLFKFLLLATS